MAGSPSRSRLPSCRRRPRCFTSTWVCSPTKKDRGAIAMTFKLKTLVAAAALAFSAAGPAQAQVSGNVVKIGVLNDQSGTYADLAGPGSTIAAKMAVEDFKAKEKGLTVEVISADHQNKAHVGSQIARKGYDSDGVDLIVDGPTSSVGPPVTDLPKEKGQALLTF